MPSLPVLPSDRASQAPAGATPEPALALPRVLLITPPFTQLNTPYPATCYLTGFLRERGVSVFQADLSLETALRLFSRDGLARLFSAIEARPDHDADERPEVLRALALKRRYLDTVDAAVGFLQGRDPTLAARICQGDFLPEGPRFDAADVHGEAPESPGEWAFGALGQQDRARWLASLYLDDLADLVRETVAPDFGLSRYAERLALAAAHFDPLHEALASPPGLIDSLLEEALLPHLDRARPELVGLTVPFPGNLYAALRIAAIVKARRPGTRVVLGGGYANTELRDVRDPRLFDFVDHVTLDDGERPMLCLLEHIAGARPEAKLKRTLARRSGEVVRLDGAEEPDVPMAESGTPTYEGLPLDRYLSVLEVLNPMHRLWSEGRWNKLTVAHGCYWKKCTFCDVSLDYIGRYDPVAARTLVDRIERLVAETGGSGFHFVDEAAPPLALVELSLELLARGRAIAWWGNIRFEKTFTPDVCRLLAAAGCIAVTGGLEVASDRLLKLIDKGVSVAQAARVTRAFADAGILVHAYLMYGFPTETEAETVESLELVRQLFAAGAIHSAYWHRFALTRHSPIFADPDAFRVRLPETGLHPFANNDVRHEDPTGCDPDRFAEGLRRALFNFMQGRGLDEDVRMWLVEAQQAESRGKKGKRGLPPPPCAPDAIERAIADRGAEPSRADARVVWLGEPAKVIAEKKRSGLFVVGRSAARLLPMQARAARWLEGVLAEATPRPGAKHPRLSALAASFPDGKDAFRALWQGEAREVLGALGLVEIP